MLIPENGNYGVTVNTPTPVQVRIEIGERTLALASVCLVLAAVWIKKKARK